MSDNGSTAALQTLLTDQFERVAKLVVGVCDGLTQQQATYRPDAGANTIAWLGWHLTRIQDDHVADLAGVEQVWTEGRWYDRLDLPFAAAAHGYGHSPDDVAQVRVAPADLAAYHADVHRATLAYVASIDSDELARVVDESWDPPVTVSVRLVSVLGDCLQHVGQAAYLRGLAERAGR